MFGWFKRNPPWEELYAQRIYDGLVAKDHLGDVTPAKLRIPLRDMKAYKSKALLNRELMCFVALMNVADPKTELPPVMMAFGRLLKTKMASRDIPIEVDDIAETAMQEVEQILTDPFNWAQKWLAEFRDDPNETFMVAVFADHTVAQFQAFKHAIEKTRKV